MSSFLVIGGAGLVLLVVALIMGDVFDLPDVIGGEVLSTAAVAGFLAAFGLTGALVVGSAGTAIATGAGVVAGTGVGGLAWWLTRVLQRDRTDPTPAAGDLVGLEGTVISPIPSQGYGEISLNVHGHLTKLNARSEEPVAAGSAVTVVAALSPTSVMVQPAPGIPAR